MSPRTLAGLLATLLACPIACAAPGEAPTASTASALVVNHTYDLAAQMPSHLAIMFSMSWFGIPQSDPQGAGPDPSYGNAEWGGSCVATNNPASCGTCVLLGAGDECLQTGAAQREMASRRRPLAGIYSASARDAEGLKRVDLMLSNVRRSCDDGAKIDAWAVQMNGTRDTAAHPSNPSCATCSISYDATQAFFAEADAAGMSGVIIPGDDSTFYFHFGSGLGLGACDDTSGNPKQNCIDALTQDFTDMAKMSAAHPSALAIEGKPVLFAYMDPAELTPAQWESILQNARNAAGQDFYFVAASQNSTQTGYFSAFDGISPWIQLNWGSYAGSTVRSHAEAWAAGMHDPLYKAVGAYPGRVVFGAATPGFDDYTEDWGQCTERQLPPGDPRDPDVLLGEFDYFQGKGTRGLVMETWDDWTEGSHFEPDVAGGASLLVSLRQQLGGLYGEAPDPAGDARLANRWNDYGQARNCDGGSAGTPPVTTLTCASGGDGGTGGGGSCSADSFGQVSNDVVGGWNAGYVDLLMDVDGDGKRDLVILWQNGSSAWAQVTLSNGTSFTRASNASVGVWDPTARNLVGDVDGDGKQDLVRVYASGTKAYAQVWKSTGSGFASSSNAVVGGWDPAYLDLVMDVNGDGKDDLVILWNGGDTAAQVNLSNGAGFTQVSNDSLGSSWDTSDRWLVGDVNGDHARDLVRVYANGTSTYAEALVSNGSAFASTSNARVGGWDPAYVDVLLDVNGDAKSDLLVLWSGSAGTTAQVNVSNGTGFTEVSNDPTGVAWSTANRYVTADTDGDGRDDLVTLWDDAGKTAGQIALSTGSGFAQASDASVGGWSPSWVDLVGDVTGDRRADLVVLWQDTTQPAGADARAQVSPSTCP